MADKKLILPSTLKIMKFSSWISYFCMDCCHAAVKKKSVKDMDTWETNHKLYYYFIMKYIKHCLNIKQQNSPILNK